MSYTFSPTFDEFREKAEEEKKILLYQQGKVFSILEHYPCALVPMTTPEYTKEENGRLSMFIFSVFQQQGLTTTLLHGTAIDPLLLPQKEVGFNTSKFAPTELLLVCDEYGEDESGRELLMFTAKVAAICKLPWFSFTGGAFKDVVLTTVVKTKENFQTPLLKVILQNRLIGDIAERAVPFFIEAFDITIQPDRKRYVFSSENEVQCRLGNNEIVTDWRKMR